MFYRVLLIFVAILECYQPGSMAASQQAKFSNYRLFTYPPSKAQGETVGDLMLSCRDEKIIGNIDGGGAKAVQGWLQGKAIQLDVLTSRGILTLSGHLIGAMGTDFEGTVKDHLGADAGHFILHSRDGKVLSDANILTASWLITFDKTQSSSLTGDDKFGIEPRITLTKRGHALNGDAVYYIPAIPGWCATGARITSKSESVSGSWDANQQVQINIANLYTLKGVYQSQTNEIRGYQVGTNRLFAMRQMR